MLIQATLSVKVAPLFYLEEGLFDDAFATTFGAAILFELVWICKNFVREPMF